MSPRYFAKFSHHPKAEDHWYHFSPTSYPINSIEYKLFSIKNKIYKYTGIHYILLEVKNRKNIKALKLKSAAAVEEQI